MHSRADSQMRAATLSHWALTWPLTRAAVCWAGAVPLDTPPVLKAREDHLRLSVPQSDTSQAGILHISHRHWDLEMSHGDGTGHSWSTLAQPHWSHASPLSPLPQRKGNGPGQKPLKQGAKATFGKATFLRMLLSVGLEATTGHFCH